MNRVGVDQNFCGKGMYMLIRHTKISKAIYLNFDIVAVVYSFVAVSVMRYYGKVHTKPRILSFI